MISSTTLGFLGQKATDVIIEKLTKPIF